MSRRFDDIISAENIYEPLAWPVLLATLVGLLQADLVIQLEVVHPLDLAVAISAASSYSLRARKTIFRSPQTLPKGAQKQSNSSYLALRVAPQPAFLVLLHQLHASGVVEQHLHGIRQDLIGISDPSSRSRCGDTLRRPRKALKTPQKCLKQPRNAVKKVLETHETSMKRLQTEPFRSSQRAPQTRGSCRDGTSRTSPDRSYIRLVKL